MSSNEQVTEPFRPPAEAVWTPRLPVSNGSPEFPVVGLPVTAILLPMLDVEKVPARKVSSERGDEMYAVDLAHYTCTCQRFKKGRAHFEERDIRRCCRHISRLLLFEKRSGKLSDFLHVMLVHRLNYGRGLWADAVRHPMRYFQIYGEDFLLVKGDTGGVEVFAPKPSGSPGYGHFGYSPTKGRWSDLGMPRHHTLVTELINEWVEAGQP